mmetsp:Transcript_11078/g.29748  ORF Transcript_11078/g.29748 Transcript_11078/m.29748 type:complete len:404 (-) Transcript_11078:9-1220(-)
MAFIALEDLAKPGGRVSGKDAHEGKQQHHGLQKAPPMGRRQEAKNGEEEGDNRHAQHLHPRSDRDCQHGRESRPAEDISVHKFPARLLPRLLRSGHLVVLGDVTVQGPQHDHGNHARQEDQDQQGVQDGKPVNLPACHLEVAVPPGGPRNFAVGPSDIVAVEDLVLLVQIQRSDIRAASLCHVLRAAAAGLHLEADNAVALVLVRIGVVLDVQSDVVVDEVVSVLHDSYQEPIHVREFAARPAVARGCREVVEDPVHQVLVLNHATEPVLLRVTQLHLAEFLASLVDPHLDLVGGVLDHVTHQRLSEVLHALHDLLRLAIWQRIVGIRKLRLHGSQLVDLQVDLLPVLVLLRGESGQVERPGDSDMCERQEPAMPPMRYRQNPGLRHLTLRTAGIWDLHGDVR